MASATENLVESYQLRVLAETLKARYHAHIGYVDLDRIVFYEDADPEADEPDIEDLESTPAIELSGLARTEWRRRQYDKGDNTRYIITAQKAIWDALSEQQRQWLMFEMLFSVDADQEGKVRKHDVKEHSCIVEHLGVHWRESAELPDLLGGEYPLSLPPPPPGHDSKREG